MAEEDYFSRYEMSGEQTGSKSLPVKLKVPIIVFQLRQNQKIIERDYIYGAKRFPNLRGLGIPENVNWERLIEERILPYVDGIDERYTCVDSVYNIEVEGLRESLLLECMLSNPHWDKEEV